MSPGVLPRLRMIPEPSSRRYRFAFSWHFRGCTRNCLSISKGMIHPHFDLVTSSLSSRFQSVDSELEPWLHTPITTKVCEIFVWWPSPNQCWHVFFVGWITQWHKIFISFPDILTKTEAHIAQIWLLLADSLLGTLFFKVPKKSTRKPKISEDVEVSWEIGVPPNHPF